MAQESLVLWVTSKHFTKYLQSRVSRSMGRRQKLSIKHKPVSDVATGKHTVAQCTEV